MRNRILVTGGSGGAGAFVVRELVEHGYEVLNADLAEPREPLCEFEKADLTDYAAVRASMARCDAVVAFASNPDPDFDFETGARLFRNNTLCTYNVFNAACELGLRKVVWASSETILGFPFETSAPAAVPVDEAHTPQPQSSYAISKVICEEAAVYLNRQYGIPFVALRLSNVLYEDPGSRDNYSRIPGYWEDPASRKFNLWSYVDARDAARCARMAVESEITGAENFIVSARDTIMKQPSAELMEAYFPDVPISSKLGEFESLISSRRAMDRLGWCPEYSWRELL